MLTTKTQICLRQGGHPKLETKYPDSSLTIICFSTTQITQVYGRFLFWRQTNVRTGFLTQWNVALKLCNLKIKYYESFRDKLSNIEKCSLYYRAKKKKKKKNGQILFDQNYEILWLFHDFLGIQNFPNHFPKFPALEEKLNFPDFPSVRIRAVLVRCLDRIIPKDAIPKSSILRQLRYLSIPVWPGRTTSKTGSLMTRLWYLTDQPLFLLHSVFDWHFLGIFFSISNIRNGSFSPRQKGQTSFRQMVLILK